MKKVLWIFVICLILLLSACQNPTAPTVDNADITIPNVKPFSVMIDGVLYCTWGQKAEVPEHISPSGKIESCSCTPAQSPVIDNTSNFDECVGQEYAFVNGRLVLYFNGQWNICERSAYQPK